MGPLSIFVVLTLLPCVLCYNVNSNSSDLYNLIPGRYPYSVSITTILDSLPDNDQGRAIVQRIIDEIENSTGVEIPDSIAYEALNDSSKLLDYAQISIAGLSDIWTGLTLAYWEGEIPNVNSSAPTVIPSPFHYPGDIAKAPVNMTDWLPTLEPMGDTLLWGYPFPTTTTLQQAQTNVVMSLVFNQLSANIHLKSTDTPFVVVYNNKNFTRIDLFLQELVSAEGYEVSTYLEWHVAQFVGIYYKDNNGNLISAADPVFEFTGIWNKNHTLEATLPAVHSQYYITVNNSAMNFHILWYQGDTSYGFFPAEMYVYTEWSGVGTAWATSGQKSIESIQYMSITQDAFIAAAQKQDLYDEGYGVTGVCDDSCGIIELIMEGETLMYPFMIQKQFVVPELLSRIKLHDQYSSYYYNILAAVNQLPTDWSGINPTSVKRAAAQIVWPAGEEPWECVVEARAIFQELGYKV